MKMQCSVCNNSNKVALEDRPLSLYRCGVCGHVFKDIAREKEEVYAEDYFSGPHKNWFNNPDYPLFEFIHKEILKIKGNRPLKVLDVGCGKGNFLKYLNTKNPKLNLYGIDLTDNLYPGISFIKGDIFKNEINTKFDVICNLAVIEHLDCPHFFIKKIRDLLSPDGVIFTVTDNDDSLIYGMARILKRAGIGAAYDRLYMTHHLQCFSSKSLMMLMEANDLDLIGHKNHNHPIEAIDYPKAGVSTMAFYAIGVRMIFALSGVFNNGILQIAVCRKKNK